MNPSDPCTVCGGPRPPVAVKLDDKFCSSTCARKHWGTELPVTKQGERTDIRREHRAKQKPTESPADVRYRQAWGYGRDAA